MVATVVRAYASIPSSAMVQIVAGARKGRRRDGGNRLGPHPPQRIKVFLSQHALDAAGWLTPNTIFCVTPTFIFCVRSLLESRELH
jgi:hypothetical protein